MNHLRTLVFVLCGCICFNVACRKAEYTREATEPSLECGMGDVYKFNDSVVQTFILLPTNAPSGEIAFKSLHDGQVKSFGSVHFEKMLNTGSLAVKTNEAGVAIAYDIDHFWHENGGLGKEIPFSQGAELSMDEARANMMSGIQLKLEDGEKVLWNNSFFVGETPSSTMNCMSFDDIVKNSMAYPTRFSYVLTIKLENPSAIRTAN